MSTKSKGRNISVKKIPDWHAIFSKVEKLVSSYDVNTTRIQGDLLRDFAEKDIAVPAKKFNQWVTKGIINSKPSSLGGYQVYDFIEIQKSYIAAILNKDYKFRPEQIYVATQLYTSKPWLDHQTLNVRDLKEGQRARLILSGRLISLISALTLKIQKSPMDTIIICRELNKDENRDRIEEKTPDYIRSVLNPREALFGWSTERLKDEVFAVLEDTSNIVQRLEGRNYYSIPHWSSSNNRLFEIILGPREHSSLNEILQDHFISGTSTISEVDPEHELLSELLSFSLPLVPNFENYLYNHLPHSRLSEDADLLSILITAVLLGDPYHWLAVAFWADDGSDMLQLQAYSSGYIKEKYPMTYRYSAETSGPFSGVLRNRSHLIFERLQEGDPRLQRGIYDPGSSCAFIPAIITTQLTVGVLQVIATPPDMPGDCSFPHSKIELLYALSRIIGEAYYRNFIASVEGIRLYVPIPAISEKGETHLRSELYSLIRDKIAPALRTSLATGQRLNSYLALFAIRIRQTLEQASYEWFLEIIRRRSYQFIRNRIIRLSSSLTKQIPVFDLESGKIVLLVGELTGEDEVRVIREGLQQKMNDIAMITPGANLDVAVWSVHVPYKYLDDNFHVGSVLTSDKGWETLCDNAVNDLVIRTYEALEVIWHVKKADELLINRNYNDAFGLLDKALTLSPGNSYVLRHISQAKTGMREYTEAVDAALDAIKSDKQKQTFFASNHHRLAEAYFGLGDFEKAFAEMEIACDRAKDNTKYNEIYAQLLIRHNDPKSLVKALRLLTEVESQIDKMDYEHLAWISVLRGEAQLRLEKNGKAQEDFIAASRLLPRDRVINWYVENNLDKTTNSDKQKDSS